MAQAEFDLLAFKAWIYPTGFMSRIYNNQPILNQESADYLAYCGQPIYNPRFSVQFVAELSMG